MKRGVANEYAYPRKRKRVRLVLAGMFARVLFAMAAVSAVALLVAGCGQGVATSTSRSTATTSASGAPGRTTDGSTTTVGPPVIKIGALYPLTGDLAKEGQDALTGMRLAVEEVNAAGGIAAIGGARLTIVQADTKGDAKTADAEVSHLVQSDGVAAIVGAGQSTVALDATEVAEHLRVPFVVSSGAADEITDRKLAYTFRLCPKADWYARDQVLFLGGLKELAGLDVRTVALLHENGDFGKQTAASERAYLAEAGIQVVADIEYPADTADVHNEVIAIKLSGAQAILTATVSSDAVLIAKDVALLHLDVPVIDAAGGMLDPNFLTQAGDAAENMMSVAEFASGSGPSRSLEQKLAASHITLDADMLYGYQSVWVLANALQRAGSTQGPRLRDALATTALTGEHLVLPQDLLTFDDTGQNSLASLIGVQVQNGRVVVVWPKQYAQGTVRLP